MKDETCKKYGFYGRCCWCGAKINYDSYGVIITHACTGEEKGAEQCPHIHECWSIFK